jgi:hypothetical protein
MLNVKKKAFVMGVLAVLVVGFGQNVARAEDQSSGCGMGWKVAPKQSLLSSTTRAYVNATFSNTSGMTSGTSGCAKHSIVQKDKEAIHFAEANQGQLMIEMAQGQGENLRGLAAIMGCSSTGATAFGKSIQQNYSRIFPNSETSASQMLDAVRTVISTDRTVAVQCGFTG